MYIFLPVLDILEIVFILLLGVAWALVVVDIFLTAFGMIQDRSLGLSEAWRSSVEWARQGTKRVRTDLATRVEGYLD